MPQYRNEFGVLLDIPAEKAARINGLTPVDAEPPTPRKRAAAKKTAPEKTTQSDEKLSDA